MIIVAGPAPSSAASGPPAFIRVNQVGYETGKAKHAFFIVAGEWGGAFEVLDEGGVPVFQGTMQPIGSWNREFTTVYDFDFSAFDVPGTYTLAVARPTTAMRASPPFRIDAPEALYSGLAHDAITFFRAQRDGRNVDRSVMNRQPSHLEQEQAYVYARPRYRNGQLARSLKRIGGPIDVSGGWFDAGDYMKFTSQEAYAEALILLTLRNGSGALDERTFDEARFGLEWLDKMWDEQSQTLYAQVGLMTGNERVAGDHDFWRLPQRDDRLNVQPGDRRYFIKHKPVFRAAAPGQPISPNIAGRMAAVFALCYQVLHLSDPARADTCLADAEAIYGLAKTQDVGRLVTAFPHGAYPEQEWRDDMELGAVELHNAFTIHGEPGSTKRGFYMQQAVRWAEGYMEAAANDDPDVLWPSNVSGLGHAELADALEGWGGAAFGLSRDRVLAELERELQVGVGASSDDAFGMAGYDAAPGVLGYALEGLLYDRVTGESKYSEFVRRQVGWFLGANPWGTTFMVGAGSVFPKCLHHQIANLAGALDGTEPILRGAVVYGPAWAPDFERLGDPGGRECPATGDQLDRFTARNMRYEDGVRAWPSVEPAIDYTAPALLLFALLASS